MSTTTNSKSTYHVGVSRTRDLTDNAQTRSILEMASQMISDTTADNAVSLESLRNQYFGFGDDVEGPVVVISAISSAESKLLMKDLPPFHLSCVIAIYGEQNRIKQKHEHPNGQDFIRNKVAQLRELVKFCVTKKKT